MLEHLGDVIHWDAQYDRVLDAARGTYKLASPRTQLWRAVGQFDNLPAELPTNFGASGTNASLVTLVSKAGYSRRRR
jgi:hypothetical protein